MKLVVDTSIIISVLIDEVEKPKIIEKTLGCEIAAPYSVHYEIGNAFSSLLKRKLIEKEKIHKALNSYKMIKIGWLDIDLSSCLDLCSRFNIYAYDAYILSCALQNNFPLFSLDKKIIEIAKKIGLITFEV